MKQRIILLLALLGGLFSPSFLLAEDRSGHIDFTPWSLDWDISDDTGLALRNVFYAGEKVLANASMPVLRVKYEKERHWWNPFSLGWVSCGNRPVRPVPGSVELDEYRAHSELWRQESLCADLSP